MRPKATLTPREVTILDLLSSGVTTNAAIGKALTIHHRTVDNYISRLIRKMRMGNRTQLAVWWWARKQAGQ